LRGWVGTQLFLRHTSARIRFTPGQHIDPPAPPVKLPFVFRTSIRAITRLIPLTLIPMGQSCSSADSTVFIEFAGDLVSGYEVSIHGEDLQYHSPIPHVDHSLLVRSEHSDCFIEWDTAPVPEDFDGELATFVMMAAIDVNDDVRSFDLYVNGERALSFENPRNTDVETLHWPGDRGVSAEFRVTEIDKYEDALGFLFLSVPKAYWEESRLLRLRVSGETAGQRTWFMVYKEPMRAGVTLRNTPALLRGEVENTQTVRAEFMYFGESGRLSLSSPKAHVDTTLTIGHRQFLIPVPGVDRPTTTNIEIHLDGETYATEFKVEPAEQLDLYLIHHTHLDIGYTHLQSEVEHLQWEHLENAVDYGEASAGNPEESQFVWNPEGLWAVESYLANHSEPECMRLLWGLRNGWIALDGLFANLLTGIATSEGLMRSMETSRRLNSWTGLEIESAMLTDIPGFTWGLVPVLAQHGVKYLSIGPNFGHRIGFFSDELGDKPFYWESPSGDERVLTWVSGAGYAWFHTGLGYSQLTNLLNEQNVFKYLDSLVANDYPYDIAHMRYNIGADNGPPDSALAETVRSWNERFVSPRLLISSTAEMMNAFEAKYGETLPVYRGDLTGHWEDGVASSARETALARRVAEELVQTEALSVILGSPLSNEELYQTWRNVFLFYEHTWGSWNSISDPEGDFTLRQWQQKKQFVESANEQSADHRNSVIASHEEPESTHFDVINTLNWDRSDIVLIPGELSEIGDLVVDEMGSSVVSQRLTSGELAFLAENVPAFGTRRFEIRAGEATADERELDSANSAATGQFSIRVDEDHGTISSILFGPADWDLVGQSPGFNEYLYVPGREPQEVQHNAPGQVGLRDAGPLVWVLETHADAPGTNGGISSEIRLYEGVGRIDILNTIDKSLVYDPEAVLYRFPFNIPAPQIRVDVPWGSFEPETDQIPGSSKNYMSAGNWVDIHNENVGVTFVTVDVPMVQFGEIRTDAIVTGWMDRFEPSATLFSYVMNNYWETNYKAGQEGFHEFRYSIRPHTGFDEASADRFANEVAQPLVLVPTAFIAPKPELPFSIDAVSTIVTRLATAPDGNGYFLRLFNPSNTEDEVEVTSSTERTLRVYRSDVWQKKLEAIEGSIRIGPYEILMLRIEY